MKAPLNHVRDSNLRKRGLPMAMKRVGALLFLLGSLTIPAQPQQASSGSLPDPYKPVLDRLQSLTSLELPDWRFHSDIAHPEDAALDDSDWQRVKVREEWKTGPRVLRRWIEIPDKLGGDSTAGSRVTLNLVLRSDDSLGLTVFSNGGVVYRGDEDMQQPILLTEHAQAGQKFLVAVRVVSGTVATRIDESSLLITPAANRPSPALL